MSNLPKPVSPKRRYMTDIPKDAEARPLASEPHFADKEELWLNGEMVGIRYYCDGKLSGEISY